jgi:hypothetical protein
MERYVRVREGIKKGDLHFEYLDAAQLIKHAFGLRTEVHQNVDSVGKNPVLFYVYAEPNKWPDGRAILRSHILEHQQEIFRFAELVAGDEVAFLSCSYQELLKGWSSDVSAIVCSHAKALLNEFDL